MNTDWSSLLLHYFSAFIVFNLYTIIPSVEGDMCSGKDLTDALRNFILEKHNSYRSQLATGKSVIKGGQMASPAKKMYKLVSFY